MVASKKYRLIKALALAALCFAFSQEAYSATAETTSLFGERRSTAPYIVQIPGSGYIEYPTRRGLITATLNLVPVPVPFPDPAELEGDRYNPLYNHLKAAVDLAFPFTNLNSTMRQDQITCAVLLASACNHNRLSGRFMPRYFKTSQAKILLQAIIGQPGLLRSPILTLPSPLDDINNAYALLLMAHTVAVKHNHLLQRLQDSQYCSYRPGPSEQALRNIDTDILNPTIRTRVAGLIEILAQDRSCSAKTMNAAYRGCIVIVGFSGLYTLYLLANRYFDLHFPIM